MAVSGTLSVWGLYQYDNTIFNSFVVPQTIDRDQVCENILIESANLEVLYPDPDFLKRAIHIWSERRSPIWAKLQETTGYVYDPIYNYDRYENETVAISGTEDISGSRTTSGQSKNTGTETHVIDGQETRTGTEAHAISSTDTNTGTEGHAISETVKDTGTETHVIDKDISVSGSTSGTSTSTDSKTAYNANTFSDAFKNSKTGSDQSSSTTADDTTDTLTLNTEKQTTGSDTLTLNTSKQTTGSDTLTLNTQTDTDTSDTLTLNTTRTDSGTESDESSKEHESTTTRTHRAYGNIGVTTTQEMIRQQREIIQFDLIHIITQEFIDKFCVGVY